jgi:hypothetical protein
MKKIKITFKDKKSKLIFDSFSEYEMNEMQKDILASDLLGIKIICKFEIE